MLQNDRCDNQVGDDRAHRLPIKSSFEFLNYGSLALGNVLGGIFYGQMGFRSMATMMVTGACGSWLEVRFMIDRNRSQLDDGLISLYWTTCWC